MMRKKKKVVDEKEGGNSVPIVSICSEKKVDDGVVKPKKRRGRPSKKLEKMVNQAYGIEGVDATEVYLKDPILWGKIYLREHFRDKSPYFHIIISKAAMENRYLAVAAPRESAKSTVLTLLHATHGIFFRRYRFIVIIQNTLKKAEGSLDSIKREFKENALITKDVNITIERDSVGDSIFRHGNGFTTRVLCKGLEQLGSIRGEKFGAYRPDLIIVDDLEDDQMVKNPELRMNLQEQFDEALIPAGQRGVCKYLIIGTPLHDDSLMAKLISKNYYPEYKKLKFPARYVGKKTGEVKSLWPEKWSVDDLNKMEELKPVMFAKEMQCDPVTGKTSKFNKEDFRYWYKENNHYVLMGKDGTVVSKGLFSSCNAAIACDLAWEDKRSSDDSVIMPGFLTPSSELLIDKYVNKKGMRPNEMAEIIFMMESRLRSITNKSVYVGFEKAKLEKVAKWFLKEEMKKRNHFLLFKDLLWGTDKVERIVSKLEPRYSQNMIFHLSGMGELEHQLLRLPEGAHDDLADCAQGLCQLLEYAPSVKKTKAPVEDEGFEWLRKREIERRKPRRKEFIFGNKGRRRPAIPFKESFR